jgi:hypothetical protein
MDSTALLSVFLSQPVGSFAYYVVVVCCPQDESLAESIIAALRRG